MASEAVLQITDDNFEQEVMNSGVPVLVDFWAEWCMPCRMLGPIIDEIAGEFDGKAKVGKVDTDANREVTEIRNLCHPNRPAHQRWSNRPEIRRCQRQARICRRPEQRDWLSASYRD